MREGGKSETKETANILRKRFSVFSNTRRTEQALKLSRTTLCFLRIYYETQVLRLCLS